MNCELFSRLLNHSPYGAKVLGYSQSVDRLDPGLAQTADVALISYDLEDGPGTGFVALRNMQRYTGTLRSVILLDRDDAALVVGAFQLGAAGICKREDSCESLCKCIYQVHQGQVWAGTQQLHHLLHALMAGYPASHRESPRQVMLTRREEQIVALVVDGQRNKAIAERMNLSEHTVKNHLFRVFGKLGVSSRSELIAAVMRRRDLSPALNPAAPVQLAKDESTQT
jgi:DNA-binding NarL/FixJ family response regulator